MKDTITIYRAKPLLVEVYVNHKGTTRKIDLDYRPRASASHYTAVLASKVHFDFKRAHRRQFEAVFARHLKSMNNYVRLCAEKSAFIKRFGYREDQSERGWVDSLILTCEKTMSTEERIELAEEIGGDLDDRGLLTDEIITRLAKMVQYT